MSIVVLYVLLVPVAFVLVMYLVSWGHYQVPATVAEDPTLPRQNLDGYDFHCETFGDPANPVVIVLHGGPGFDYKGLLPLSALSDAYYVVFYDQRGTGLSPRVEGAGPDLASAIHDVDLFVDHFGKGKKVHIIGHSWGGMLASAYVGKYREKVAALVLAEPGFLTTDMMKLSGVRFGPRWELGFLALSVKAFFQSLHIRTQDKQARMDYFFGQIAPYANREYYCADQVPAAGKDFWRVGSKPLQSVLGSSVDERGHFDINLIDGVENYQDEVLFIASACNDLIGVEFQKQQMAFYPKAHLEVIADCGHMMFGEKPEESVAIVRAFLDGEKL